MSQDIRRELISKNLGIKPINHGQVHAFQIALPESRQKTISLEKRQAIEKSLLAHQSNLISLIIRRTDAYDDDDIEYELVYGADWLQVAQALNIEKLWAWVFDMTDEQATFAAEEMEALTEPNQSKKDPTSGSDETYPDIGALIDDKLQLATDSIKNSLTPILNKVRSELDDNLRKMLSKFDSLSTLSNFQEELSEISERLKSIEQKLGSHRTIIEPVSDPINLLEASDKDIEIALRKVNANKTQIKAAIDVVNYWKRSNQGLSWGNLELSSRSSERIKGFGQKTYERLQMISIIPEHSAD